ncbi:unnamed protein product, partial [Rotaria sp. Silwood1]
MDVPAQFERFFRPRQTLVATCFGSIPYPLASALAFKQFPDGRQELVVTGSLLSVNHDRIILKRLVLNDVNWFKPIELRTQDEVDEDILKNHLKQTTTRTTTIVYDGEGADEAVDDSSDS